MHQLCRCICVAAIILLLSGGSTVSAASEVKLAGLKVVTIAPSSAAARAGLKHGDILIAYNSRPITTEEEFEAVMRFFRRQHDQTGEPAVVELSLYRDADLTVRTVRVPIGRLGIFTREWTFAGALIEGAIGRNDYVSAARYVAEAAGSGRYTDDQILHMRLLTLDNEREGDEVRRRQVEELYRKYSAEKLRLFANYDLLHHKRYRAGAAVFEKYLKIKGIDVATELTLALCYTEIEKYEEAAALLGRIEARPKTDENAATDYILSELANLRARIYMGRGQYGLAQEHFRRTLDQYGDDSYYVLAFLYCAARREVAEGKSGEFEAAYKLVSERSEETEELMGYHIDALRVFVLMKRQRVSVARDTVAKWRNSVAARQFVPTFWRTFPDGAEIIKTWNQLLGEQALAVNVPYDVADEVNQASGVACRNQLASRGGR